MYIGDTNIVNSPFVVWTDDRGDSDLRQSERLLFSRLDLLTTYYGTLSEDDSRRNIVNNLLVLYYVELQLIKEFGENDDYLYRAGVVLSNYVRDIMSREFTNDYERNSYVLSLIEDIKRRTINGTTSVADISFMGDWYNEVYRENYYVNIQNGFRSENKPIANIAGVDTTLESMFKEVAGNLVYSVVPYSTISTAEAKKKRIMQTSVISGVCGSGFGFTEAICNNYIQSSIYGGVGMSPERYVETMKAIAIEQSQGARVGDIATATAVVAFIAKLITALAGAVTIFKVIRDMRKESDYSDAVEKLKYAEVCGAEIPDWLRLGDIDGDGTDDTFKVWAIALALGAVAYLYQNKKK